MRTEQHSDNITKRTLGLKDMNVRQTMVLAYVQVHIIGKEGWLNNIHLLTVPYSGIPLFQTPQDKVLLMRCPYFQRVIHIHINYDKSIVER